MPKESFKDFVKREYGVEYGKGEVKVFTPQIKKALRIIAAEGVKKRSTIKKLRELGFKVCKSSGVAFVGDTQVIKKSFLFSNVLPIPPKEFRVPTLILDTNGYNNLMVQPRAIIPSMKERHKIVSEISPRVRNGYDVHEYNVGKYKNKSVLFDW